MIIFLTLINILISFLNLYISISVFFNFKKPFDILNILIIPIFVFEIISTIGYIFSNSMQSIAPTILVLLGNNIFVNIFYIFISNVFIIGRIKINDNFLKIYRTLLTIYLIFTSLFTLLLYL